MKKLVKIAVAGLSVNFLSPLNSSKVQMMEPQEIQNKRRGKPSSKFSIFYENTCGRRLLNDFEWDIFDRPPNGPDLAPNDYGPAIKTWLITQSFDSDAEPGIKISGGGFLQS